MKPLYLFGWHTVKSRLSRHPETIRCLYVQQGRHDARTRQLIDTAKALGISVQVVHSQWFSDKGEAITHQGIAAECAASNAMSTTVSEVLENIEGQPFLLVLDQVTDPHNLGACLRSAAVAGVHAVIVPRDHSAGLTAVVHKVASGAADIVPLIAVTNLARALTALKERGIWIVGTAEEATQSLYDTDLRGPIAIVMGAEDQGLRRLTRDHCDVLVSIPHPGALHSLNVSVATGVALFEAVRQRQQGQRQKN